MGYLPQLWKESVTVPICNLSKDPNSAFTSHVGKAMEKMMNESLKYYIKSKGLSKSYQSGFRLGKGTLDPALCLENEIRKAQINKEC